MPSAEQASKIGEAAQWFSSISVEDQKLLKEFIENKAITAQKRWLLKMPIWLGISFVLIDIVIYYFAIIENSNWAINYLLDGSPLIFLGGICIGFWFGIYEEGKHLTLLRKLDPKKINPITFQASVDKLENTGTDQKKNAAGNPGSQ